MRLSGRSNAQIQADLKISRGALRSTLTKDQLRDEGKNQLRCGTPLKYTEADERNLIRHVRLNPKDTYAQVIEACALNIKKDTVKKILKQYGIINWRARRRPHLTEKNAKKRLAWCRKMEGLTAEEWGLYMWSDECSVERGQGKRDE